MSSLRTVLVVGWLLLGFGCRPGPPPPPGPGGSESTVPVEEISIGAEDSIPPAGELVFADDDWPQWRGIAGTVTTPGEDVPVHFSDTKNVIWKTPVPGRGHSTPTLVGSRIFLTTADEQKKVQQVLAFDRATGRSLWSTDIHAGNFETNIHTKNSQASATIACDGERVFALFLNDLKVRLTALTVDGEKLWTTDVGPYLSRFGFGSSPTIYKQFVIVNTDNQGGGCIAAVHRRTGEIIWRKERPVERSYCSPFIFHLSGKDQLLVAGAEQVASYDPNTGEQFWTVRGTTKACVATAVVFGDFVYATGGYPGSETLCVKSDGSGKVMWRDKNSSYVPSLLQYEGVVYCVNDKGLGFCYDAVTGDLHWRARLGGNFSASPILAGENIYAASEQGKVTVFRHDTSRFDKVAENQLGTQIMATPVACGNRLYIRAADDSQGKRNETLYCIGNADTASSSVQ